MRWSWNLNLGILAQNSILNLCTRLKIDHKGELQRQAQNYLVTLGVVKFSDKCESEISYRIINLRLETFCLHQKEKGNLVLWVL